MARRRRELGWFHSAVSGGGATDRSSRKRGPKARTIENCDSVACQSSARRLLPARRPVSGACPDIRPSNRLCATPISTVSVFPASTFLPTLNPIEPPWYGPVCPVVWEGWRREVSPYPDHRPFSVAQLRNWNGSSCPKAAARYTRRGSARLGGLPTFAEATVSGKLAPNAVVCRTPVEPRGPTLKRHSWPHQRIIGLARKQSSASDCSTCRHRLTSTHRAAPSRP